MSALEVEPADICEDARRCVHGLHQLVATACDLSASADARRLRAFHGAVHLQGRLRTLADATELRLLKDRRINPRASGVGSTSLRAAAHAIAVALLQVNDEIGRRRSTPSAEGAVMSAANVSRRAIVS